MPIIKRAGKAGTRYQVRVNHRGTPHFGGTYTTEREAKRAEKALVARLEHEGDIAATTVSEWRTRWLELIAGNVRTSTLNTYTQATAAFAEQYGNRRLSSITRAEAHDWVRLPKKAGSRSPLVTMFSAAINAGRVNANPFANLRTGSSRGRKDITALTTAEVAALADAARHVHGAQYGAEVAALIILAAYSGMRRGELAVLAWDDINFSAGTVNVSKTLSADVEILTPKNSKERTIALPPIAADALRAVPRHLHRDRVFGSRNGKLLTRSNFHYTWNPVRVAADKPKLHFHELRHHAATYYVDVLGLHPTDAARQLGHSDAGRLLLSVYVHPDENRALGRIHDAFKNADTAPTPINQRNPQ